MRIDTHIHLYDTRREGSSTFLDPVRHKKIYNPHLPEDFLRVSSPCKVNYGIAVEASQRPEDNYWLIDIVNGSESMLACIGNLDPRDPGYLDDLDNLSKNRKFRGIRIRPRKPIDLSDPGIIEKLGELDKRGLVLELGVNHADPKAVSVIAMRYPRMNIIINHLAGGRIVDGVVKPDDWHERLKVFASHSNVYCKISMLYNLSGKNPAPTDINYYRPIIDPVVEAFGPERVMFGSNWTLDEMLGSYSDLIQMLDSYCAGRNDLSSEQFYSKNALGAYGIKVGRAF